MSKHELHLRIISPLSIEYDEIVDMVVMPGAEGEFGVLPEHMPIIASLKEGQVKIHANGKVTSIDITKAVATFQDNKLDILIG